MICDVMETIVIDDSLRAFSWAIDFIIIHGSVLFQILWSHFRSGVGCVSIHPAV